MYDQLQDCFSRFNSEDTIKESMHANETQINESLNQAVSRCCPKFKLFGSSMTLNTRVSSVLCKRNDGFDKYYHHLYKQLNINQQDCKQYYLEKGINALHDMKTKHYQKAVSKDYRRKRKHNIEAKKREQIFAARTEKQIGTYGSGKAFDSDSEKEDTVQKN